MGLGSLNPFKKSKDKLSVPHDNNLAPTKSTSSVANSIRSIKKEYEHLTEDGTRPDSLLGGIDVDKNGKNPLPSLAPGNFVGNLSPNVGLSNGALR